MSEYPVWGYVYFIQASDNGPLKIGYTKAEPHARLAALQSSLPISFEFLGAIEGTHVAELNIMKVLGRWRIKGEWFEPHEKVIAAIQCALESGIRWKGAMPPVKARSHGARRLRERSWVYATPVAPE